VLLIGAILGIVAYRRRLAQPDFPVLGARMALGAAPFENQLFTPTQRNLALDNPRYTNLSVV
jgi:hypothetical protein